jgi:hypothetical protein
VRFRFRTRSRAAETHVGDYEIVFEEGALCGLKLVGGSLWRSRHDDAHAERLYVPLPGVVPPLALRVHSAPWNQRDKPGSAGGLEIEAPGPARR